jgi:hypothetical protein
MDFTPHNGRLKRKEMLARDQACRCLEEFVKDLAACLKGTMNVPSGLGRGEVLRLTL